MQKGWRQVPIVGFVNSLISLAETIAQCASKPGGSRGFEIDLIQPAALVYALALVG